MFPSVAFRPVLLLGVCGILTAAAIGVSAWMGHALFGVFFGIGLLLGFLNAVLVQRSVASITAEVNPVKRKMAVNSATRLLVITTVGLAIAFIFRPLGLGVVFGLAVFQIVLVLGTALPVWKKIRTGDPDEDSFSNPASATDNMLKD